VAGIEGQLQSCASGNVHQVEASVRVDECFDNGRVVVEAGGHECRPVVPFEVALHVDVAAGVEQVLCYLEVGLLVGADDEGRAAVGVVNGVDEVSVEADEVSDGLKVGVED